MLRLDYNAAHRFVDTYPGAHWDGYTMVLWKETETGFNHPRGLRKDGKWGVARRIDVDDAGFWKFRV